MANEPRDRDAAALEPSVKEHGEYGYTSTPVGGFGGSYADQVAHGSDGAEAPTSAGDLEATLRRALADAHVDAAAVVVQVQGAHAVLTGTVRTLDEKHQLGAIARGVTGISEVHNELAVLEHGSPA